MYALLLVHALVAPLSASPPGEYLVVMTADSVPYRPSNTHSFAALATIEQGPDGASKVAKVDGISWLPTAGKLRVTSLRPEPGRNVPFDETLAIYRANGSRLCAWGPYRVNADFAERFRAKACDMEGKRYRALWSSAPDVTNCTRTLLEVVDPTRRYIGPFGYGAAAGNRIVEAYRPWLVAPCETHPEVDQLLGLCDLPLERMRHGASVSRGDQMSSALSRGRR